MTREPAHKLPDLVSNAGGHSRIDIRGIRREIRNDGGSKEKMRRRNEYERDSGYEGRGRSQRNREERDNSPSYRRGMSSFRGASDIGDERYFGGGRQYGEGYSGGTSSQSWGDSDRGFRGSQDYGDDSQRGYGGGSRGGGGYESRYSGDRESQDRDYGYGRGGMYGTGMYGGDRYTSGMYGGGIGGYVGGGYQGYNPESYDRGYRSNRGYGSSDYPRSESGYYSGGRSGHENERGWMERAGDEVASWFGDEEAERRRQRDQRENHRGKGPKNYTRSDDRIKEDVSDRLEDHYSLDASEIDIEVNDGDVVLTGTVESRYAKRLAEDLADDCSGVKNVENRIRVDSNWHQNRSNATTTTSSDSSTSGTQSKSASGR